MNRVLIQNLDKFTGQEVIIQGWIQTIRDQKKMLFLILRDHSGLVQVVLEKSKNPELASIAANLNIESCVSITGLVMENPQVKLGGVELQLSDIRIENIAASPLPFDLLAEERPSLDKRLDWRFLDLRRPEHNLIFRTQTTAEMAMREFWTSEGFIEMHSPKLMGSASESGAELFKLEYFEKTAYLAQSPQFYKQMAMAAGFDRVFEVGPVFRANPSFTSRHDTEFTSVDVEISWVTSHEDVMNMEERWLQHILKRVREKHGAEIKRTFAVEINVPTLPFPRVTMEEAYEILARVGHKVERGEKGDLDPEGERSLAKYIYSQHGHEFVFVTDYPVQVRPFYHMRYEHNPALTKSFDLIWKGIEVTTGAQREHRYNVLLQQAMEKNLSLEPIQYYLDCFKYGCPPHGGYGFGLTRMLMVMLGLRNVREVTYLYRGPNRLSP